ncbi:hypothetical protein INR49_021683 [Caranx melampygus]|nr:hypothetical protein INR49_021683 [Caranx melampygus]
MMKSNSSDYIKRRRLRSCNSIFQNNQEVEDQSINALAVLFFLTRLTNMAVHLSYLLLLIGLTRHSLSHFGVHGITTVSEVSVKPGDSITIPCFYDPQYRSNVKYLCKGYYWSSCLYQADTNQKGNSERFSLSDDKNQTVFTVTIKDLRDTDTDYWCIVTIDGRADIGQSFQLSITTEGLPGLYVDHQEVTGFIGESVSISCFFSNSGESSWCRLDGTCVKMSSGSIGGTRVTINATVSNVFTVTMSELMRESSGWYYCVNGNLQMPVHVTVTERSTTSIPGTNMSSTLESVTQFLMFTSKDPSTVQPSDQHSLLTIINGIVALSIWLMFKRSKWNNKADAPAEENMSTGIAVNSTIQDTMAVPPTYADLGKSAKDIFNKGYGFGLVKLDVKTKSASGVEFKTSGSSNTDTSKVAGSLETKYKRSEYGLTFTEKWNTDNTLGTEITVEDQIAKGLKLTFDTTFSPNTGKKSGKVKTAYKREYVNLGCDVDFDFAGPTIHGAAVVGYEGWLAGYQMSFDTAKSKMTQNNFAIGYKTGDFQLHTNVNDGSEFGGSIYQKVSDKLETAVNLSWTAGSNSTRFGIAAKYQLDKDASISAKVNNNSLVGVGYTQTLRPGVKITLSTLVDGKNINAGGHKLGLGLELEA